MNSMQSHMIQKLILELSASGSVNNLDWERHAAHFHDKVIQPVIEECFQEFPLQGKHLVIDRLEIDLGNFSPGTFENEARERLIHLLRKNLKQFNSQNEIRNSRGLNQIHLLLPEEPEIPVLQGSQLQALAAFLSSGRFPWWYVIEQEYIEEIEKQFGLDWVLSLGKSEQSLLRRLLLKHENARIRIVNHFSTEWLAECLQHIGLSGLNAHIIWNLILPVLNKQLHILNVFRQHFWTNWINVDGDVTRFPSIRSVFAQCAGVKVHSIDPIAAEVNRLYLNQKDKTGFLNQVAHLFEAAEYPAHTRDEDDVIGLSKNVEAVEKPDHDSRTESETGVFSENINQKGGDSENTELAGNQQQKGKLSESPEPIYKNTGEIYDHGGSEDVPEVKSVFEEKVFFIEASGSVLLHPFLTELFRTTSLWNDDGWIYSGAQNRAVHLLSFLSYGSFEVPEYRLTLHKLLSGLQIDTALQAEPKLNRKESEACEELLHAIISHWKALRNTTGSGLREAFLQRDGKLTMSGNGYHLQIEKKTEDILLSRLPWGYSLIMLPWMDKMLHVSWV